MAIVGLSEKDAQRLQRVLRFVEDQASLYNSYRRVRGHVTYPYRPRVAYCKVNAGSGATIACFLDTDTTGTEITVYCRLFEGATNLSDCTPKLQDGDAIDIYFDGTNWRCFYAFIFTEECD